MTHSIDILNQILTQVQSRGARSLVVFDLDSTLFDVTPRTARILKEMTECPRHVRIFPKSLELLRRIELEASDWGFEKAFRRLGLHEHPRDFQLAVQQFWRERFFHGDWLQYDHPLPGAVDFTQQLSKAGARLVYLTGRDLGSMYEASRMVLESHGFPPGELILKARTDLSDSDFKRGWFASQNLQRFDAIYFFENEPLNLQAVAPTHPLIQVVFVETTHSGRLSPQAHWPKVTNFKRSLE